MREKQIVISGKVAQEIGFDKIRREQAQLSELKIVILDGVQVAFAYAPDSQEKTPSIKDICPKVTDLDLSRSLFTQFGTVVEICSELKHLRTLRVKSVSPVLILLERFANYDAAEIGSKMCSKTRALKALRRCSRA